MKYVNLTLALLIALVYYTQATSTSLETPESAISYNSPNEILSPTGIITHTTNENQYLTFLEDLVGPGTLNIYVTNLPLYATMPDVTGTSYIRTDFQWTPGYCQSGSYSTFVDKRWGTSQVEFNEHRITVTNINRPPQITTSYNPVYYVPVGQKLIVGAQATDIDNLECNEDAFISMGYSFTPKNGTNATMPEIFFDQIPVVSGNALFVAGPFTSANIGRWDLTFSANDGGIENFVSTKSMTVVVYQPSSSSSCRYDKKGGWLACS